jgi:hypothetical protein
MVDRVNVFEGLGRIFNVPFDKSAFANDEVGVIDKLGILVSVYHQGGFPDQVPNFVAMCLSKT